MNLGFMTDEVYSMHIRFAVYSGNSGHGNSAVQQHLIRHGLRRATFSSRRRRLTQAILCHSPNYTEFCAKSKLYVFAKSGEN